MDFASSKSEQSRLMNRTCLQKCSYGFCILYFTTCTKPFNVITVIIMYLKKSNLDHGHHITIVYLQVVRDFPVNYLEDTKKSTIHDYTCKEHKNDPLREKVISHGKKKKKKNTLS